MVIETPFLLVLLLRRVVMMIRPLELLDPAVKLRVFTALLALRLVQEMSAGTPPEFTRAVTRKSTAEIAAAVA